MNKNTFFLWVVTGGIWIRSTEYGQDTSLVSAYKPQQESLREHFSHLRDSKELVKNVLLQRGHVQVRCVAGGGNEGSAERHEAGFCNSIIAFRPEYYVDELLM